MRIFRQEIGRLTYNHSLILLTLRLALVVPFRWQFSLRDVASELLNAITRTPTATKPPFFQIRIVPELREYLDETAENVGVSMGTSSNYGPARV